MEVYDRLCQLSTTENWEELADIFDNKITIKHDNGKINRKLVAKLSEIVTRKNVDLPTNILMSILKYLMMSCENLSNKPEEFTTINSDLKENYWHEFYKLMSRDDNSLAGDKNLSDDSFPYEGVGQWTIDYLVENGTKGDDEIIKSVKRCICFLCNIICSSTQYGLPKFVQSDSLKSTILKLLESDDKSVLHPLCALIHNILFNSKENYFNDDELLPIVAGLIRDNTVDINPAHDSIMLLLKSTPKFLDTVYHDLPIDRKLHLLEMIYQNLKDIVYDETASSEIITEEAINFLKDRFKKRSDLILKTEKSYLDGLEPTEVTILLDILTLISSNERDYSLFLQADTSLLINAIFLLKALHMTGKESENNFTPLQKINDVAPNSLEKTVDPESHPVFGFKVGLIRLIGNLVHQHKKNQDMVRELDGISLLLDCCNVDARNPLIKEWTITAVRHLCHKNPDNQKFIADSHKIKTIDNTVIREMGLKIHEDENGKAIGVVPLPRNR